MTTHIIRNKIFMKVLSLVTSILFAASNITFATPKDYSALRQPSTAVSRSVEVISEEIAEADNEIYHNEISAARKLFREGESLWLRAKNSPDKDNVKELANEAIGKFEEAKEILDILSIKDIDAKRLLGLIQGDKPEKRIAGHIGRAQKTIKEAEKKTDLYKEDGNVDRSAKRPTSQYLHADPKGLIHATVGFFIFTPDGNIVFQRRAPDKVFFPNMLTLAACGHPDRARKGEIKDIFTATKDEARGETGIPRIYGMRIRKIGHPDKIKGPYKYDQRVDFIAYEFVATSKEEAEALKRISDEINEREKKTSASVFDRLICNYNDEIWTLTLYTFGWDKKDAIEEKAKEIVQRTGIPIGDVNYNREVKSLYAYVATEEEIGILKTKKTEHKEAEVAKFEIDTRSIEEIARDFQNNPEKYPDTFIPTFTNPVIVKQLADFQKEIRKNAEAKVIADLKKSYLSKIPPASESAIKMVIFDWGNVLDRYDYRIAAKKLADRYGVDEDKAYEFFEARNTDPENILFMYEKKGILELELKRGLEKAIRKMTAKKVELTDEDVEEIIGSPLIEDIPESLHLVRALIDKGYEVRILTTTSPIYHRVRLKRLELPKLLKNGEWDIYPSFMRGVAKPHPASIWGIADDARLFPEQVLFVDDRLDCEDGAIRAGAKFRLFDPKDLARSIKNIVVDLLTARRLQRYLNAIPPASESSVKLLIFDQGNVVTRYDYQRIAEELHSRFGIGKETVYNFCEARHTDTNNPLWKYEHGRLNEQWLAKHIRKWLRDNLRKPVRFTEKDAIELLNKFWVGNIPETVALIRDLKAKGYKIRGLATTTRVHYQYVSNPANRIGLATLVDDPSEDFCPSYLAPPEYIKPNPLSFLRIVDKAKVKADQALMVDDTPVCADGATVAGLMACLFKPENPLESVKDIANVLSDARTLSTGVSAVPDEGAGRILKAIRNKTIYPSISERGVIDKNKGRLSEFWPMPDIVFALVRAARARFRNLTEFITVEEILDYLVEPTIFWESGGFTSAVSIKEDESDYFTARKIISSLDITCRDVSMAKACLEKRLYKDNAYEIAMATLNRFGPGANMRWITKRMKEQDIYDSAFLCGLPIPKVDDEDEYLKELERRFHLSLSEMETLKKRFASHISVALKGIPRYFEVYKGHIGSPAGDEKGRYLILEVGGSNIYLSMVELKANRKYEIFRYQPKFAIAENMKKGKGQAYFDYIAGCIEEFLKEYEKSRGPGDGYKLGFIFSFALKKTGIDKATVVETSKEYDLEGVIGQDPVDMLKDALKRKNIRNIEISSVGNDTESLEAGAAYIYENCTESLVLATGYNMSILAKGDIFNTEAGDWNDEYFSRRRTVFDKAIDAISLNRGSYLAEKILSGQYLGEIARRILYDMITRGLLFKGKSSPVFSNPWQFKTKYMDRFEGKRDFPTFKAFLEGLVKERVTFKDCGIVRRVCDIVTTRAAKAVAVALAAAIENTDPNLKRSHNILVEGALFEFHPTLKHKIKKALREIFGEKASEIDLVLNRDATKVGAAVMAAMAEKAKSSSAGSASVREILRPSESPIIFNVTSMPMPEPELADYSKFREDLLRGHGFHPSSFVENFEVLRDSAGQEFVLKPDSSNEALAYYLAQAVGFKDIGKVLLFIAPDGMYASGLKSYALVEYYNGITFSATDRHFPRISIDSELYKQHPKLRDLTLEGIDFDAWSRILADPAQMARSDLFRIFTNNLESTWVRNLLYKECDNDKVEIRFIDYQPAFSEDGFEEKEIISHLKKYADYYLKYCPQLLRNIVNLSDEDIEYIVSWVYRQELLDVRVGVEDPARLIENMKRSRGLIKETLGDIITEIETTGKTPVDKDTSQRTNPVYTLPEELTVKNKKLRIVPLTPELMIKKADEFFILQNSVAADVVWTKERDVIGVAKGRKDGPIQFAPELNCSFAALDENDAPVAVAIYSSTDKRKGYAYLKTFAVLPEYQGTAVASWILLHSFQEAQKQGFTYASWIAREELDEVEKQHPLQKYSARAIPYYENKVKAERDEKKGENGRIPPKEETGDDNVPWEVRPGKWHVAYHKDLSDLYSLYADFKAKSALCTISDRVDTAIRVNTAIDTAA